MIKDILEKKYNIFDKNLKMLADVASVEYGIKLGDIDFSLDNSFRRVVDGLNDLDVYVGCVGNYFDIYNNIKSGLEFYIENYPNYSSNFKKLIDYDLDKKIKEVQNEFVLKFNSDTIRVEKITIDDERKKEYNLIDLFVNYQKFNLLDNLLVLDIEKKYKLNVLSTLFSNLRSDNENYDRIFDFIRQDKYKEIVSDYCKTLLTDDKIRILKNSPVEVSLMLQNNNLLDFNDENVLFSLDDEKKVAPVVKLLEKSSYVFNNLSDFYGTSYLNYPEEIRKNTDSAVINIILNRFYSLSYAKRILNFENFNVNNEVIDVLSKYFISSPIKKSDFDEMNKIIISKSKNSRDYRKNINYVKRLKINTNKEMLKMLRKELLNTLYGTIDNSINTKVGDIKVYKKN